MNQVQALTEKFASDLTLAIRRQVIENVEKALGGGKEQSWPEIARKHLAGGGERIEALVPRQLAPSIKPRTKRRVGQKRTEAQITATQERVLARVQKAPGSSSEMLQRALSLPKEDITLPLQKLLANKTIKKSGHKRSTKYYPATKSKKN